MAVISAKGTLLKLGDGASPETFATIGQVRSISGPTTAADIVDITTHSTSGYWRQRFAVLITPGDITFPMNYDKTDATHAFTTGLWNLFINLTQRNFKMTFPSSAGELAFNAQVNRHEFMAPVDNVLQANMGLTIFNAITATN